MKLLYSSSIFRKRQLAEVNKQVVIEFDDDTNDEDDEEV